MNSDLIDNAELSLDNQFKRIDKIALENQKKVLTAFRENKIASRHFSGSNGYGYDDAGRDTLSQLFASVFHAEDGIVSPLITCGSHAISLCLFGLLRPDDVFLSVSGKPYDTLDETIFGLKDIDNGSLKDFGVKTEIIYLKQDGSLDEKRISDALIKTKPKVVYLQRSRGYEWRKPLSIDDIEKLVHIVRNCSKDSFIVVDNCYGEFVEEREPTDVGVDICVGSLIKNPGGGLAPTGAYIVGTKRAIDLVATRFTSPSLKTEVGSYESGYRLFYEGLFLAPSTVKNALKGAYLLGKVMEEKGYSVLPSSEENAFDIIKSIKFNTKEELISFVQIVQKFSPVDSFVLPLPWNMPGYQDEVIMAAGTFVSGASIEFSCDSPIKAPYVAYFQGGLTYEQIKIATEEIAKLF